MRSLLSRKFVGNLYRSNDHVLQEFLLMMIAYIFTFVTSILRLKHWRKKCFFSDLYFLALQPQIIVLLCKVFGSLGFDPDAITKN